MRQKSVTEMVRSIKPLGSLASLGIAAACALATPVLAQNDKMTPIPIPAQPSAIELGTRYGCSSGAIVSPYPRRPSQ